MTDDTKRAFLTAVVGLQGGKSVEVLSRMARDNPEALESFHPDLPDELVREWKLVEVEYMLPTMAYKVKSFFLPAGTVVRVRFGDRDVLAVPSPKPGDPDYDPKNDPDASNDRACYAPTLEPGYIPDCQGDGHFLCKSCAHKER